MIIVIEFLFIVILIMIMATLVLDEKHRRKRSNNLVKLKNYWDGKNRRHVERYNVNLNVHYTINSALKISKSRDISTHGIGLMLEEKLEKRTPLSIEIKLKDQKQTIRAKGRVMWSKEAIEEEKYSPKRLFSTGIKFLRFNDPLQEKKLFDYIRSIEKEFSPNNGIS